MVLIFEDNSEHVKHAWKKIGLSGEKKSEFMADLYLIKCFKQTKNKNFSLLAQLILS